MDGLEHASTGAIEPEARTFGMLSHLSALAGLLFPFGHILGPLVVWLIKKDQYPFVDEHGKESLNFQITLGIAHLALIAIAVVTCGFAAIITIPLNLLLLIGGTVYAILGGLEANKGLAYKYPFAWRLIK